MMMKRIIISSIFVLFVCNLFAQTIKIWNNTSVKSNWSELTLFLPDSNNNNHTAIIICPGGSYHHLGMKHEGYEVAKKMAKEGFTAFVLKYRVGMWNHQHPAMIQDIQRSIQIVKERANLYGYLQERVGLIGFSAGGHLVGSAATFFEENYLLELGILPTVSLKPLFTVMVYPVVTMLQPYGHIKSRKNLLGKNPTDSLINKMSLEKNVTPNMANILILQAKDDQVVNYNNALLLDSALMAKSVDSKLILYNTGGHGFGAFPKINTEFHSWFSDMMIWLKEIKITN
jgi:acetyl esterase/lipase